KSKSVAPQVDASASASSRFGCTGDAARADLGHYAADDVVGMRVSHFHARERGQLWRQELDAVVDQQPAVDLRRLADQPPFEQVLGLLAHAGDDGIERPPDLRFIA